MAEKPHSMRGIVSFIISLIVGTSFVICMLAAGVLRHVEQQHDFHTMVSTAVGLELMLTVLAAFLGAAIGYSALFSQRRKLALALTGLFLNGAVVLAFAGLYVVATMLK